MSTTYTKEETDLWGKEGYIVRVYKWGKDTETQLKVEAFIDKADYANCTKERLGEILQRLVEEKRP